jgi:hypothetical protein
MNKIKHHSLSQKRNENLLALGQKWRRHPKKIIYPGRQSFSFTLSCFGSNRSLFGSEQCS